MDAFSGGLLLLFFYSLRSKEDIDQDRIAVDSFLEFFVADLTILVDVQALEELPEDFCLEWGRVTQLKAVCSTRLTPADGAAWPRILNFVCVQKMKRKGTGVSEGLH